jgi:hypothetical protein
MEQRCKPIEREFYDAFSNGNYDHAHCLAKRYFEKNSDSEIRMKAQLLGPIYSDFMTLIYLGEKERISKILAKFPDWGFDVWVKANQHKLNKQTN